MVYTPCKNSKIVLPVRLKKAHFTKFYRNFRFLKVWETYIVNKGKKGDLLLNNDARVRTCTRVLVQRLRPSEIPRLVAGMIGDQEKVI